MDFVDMATKSGARYVDYGNSTLYHVLKKENWDDAFALYFNDNVMRMESWDESLSVLWELLDEKRKVLILVVDCDATGEMLEKSYISQFCKGSSSVGITVATKD